MQSIIKVDMPKVKEYNRQNASEYARRWAYGRNPDFFDFSEFGGDCTNFISQCLFAGGGVMNDIQFPFWFYFTAFHRSPSWSGVEFLYDFLIKNQTSGPFAERCMIDELEVGDIVQLDFLDRFAHSLFVTKILKDTNRTPNDILIATHTIDAYDKPVSRYLYRNIRFLKIKGIYQ